MGTQRNVKYLIMALLFACANSIYAASIAIINDVYYEYVNTNNNRYAAVIKRYDAGTNTLWPYVGDVDIPSYIEVDNVVYPVKYINTDAFQGCTNLTGINLPNTIEKINSRAFFGCTSLSTINLPSSLTEIGAAAFYKCSNLTTIMGLETSKVNMIGTNAFCECNINHSLVFPNTLEEVQSNAFENATQSTTSISITFPLSLKRIGDKAFRGVVLSSLYIPRNVVNIGSLAFDTYRCSSISVDPNNIVYDSRENCNAVIDKWNGTLLFACNYTTIPHGVTGIASYAFHSCHGLVSIDIPQSVTTIGSYAFFDCTKLKTVRILGEVTELQESCFNQCPIEELVLPTTLKKIGPSALNRLYVESLILPTGLYFIGNGAISSATIRNITLPSTVSYIGSEAIKIGAGSALTFEGDVPGYVAEDAFGRIDTSYNPLDRLTLKVKKDYYDNYIGNHPWNKFGTIETINTSSNTEPSIDDVEDVTEVNFVDGQTYSATNYRRAATLTYSRNFQNTMWQALYVPFTMEYNDWKDDYDIARLNAIRMYDNDDDGEYDETELEIIKVLSGNIYANHPYFIRAKNAGEKEIILTNALVYPAESNSIDCSTVETSFELTGTYRVISGIDMVSNKYYALSRGQFCYTTNTNAYLNPNRWYMKVTERNKQVFHKTNLSRMRVIVKGENNDEILDDFIPNNELFDGEQTTTGICTSPSVDAEDDAPIFTLEGTCLNANETLMPGIYIRNGKKYVVR